MKNNKCLNCGNEIYSLLPKKYCNSKCGYKYRNRNVKKNKKLRAYSWKKQFNYKSEKQWNN